MTYQRLTAPAVEPLTLDDVKAHLRLDGTDEDATLTSLIAVGRDHMERATGLLPITQSWRLYVDSLSEDSLIQIVKGPLQRIDAARFHDASGAVVPLDVNTMAYERDDFPARVSLGRGDMSGAEVDFTAGLAATGNEVPGSIRRALLLHVAAMFEYRGAVAVADQPAVLPEGYERLLAPFRMRGL